MAPRVSVSSKSSTVFSWLKAVLPATLVLVAFGMVPEASAQGMRGFSFGNRPAGGMPTGSRILAGTPTKPGLVKVIGMGGKATQPGRMAINTTNPGGGGKDRPKGMGGMGGKRPVHVSNIGGGGQPTLPTTNPSQQSGPSGGSGVPPAGESRYVPNEVVFEVASGLPARTVEALARRHRLTRLESMTVQLSGTTFHRWRITGGRSVPSVVRALEAEGIALAVQPNYWAFLNQDTAETVGMRPLEQYALAKLRVPQAHGLATGDKVLIAVIDSGVDTGHPELAGMIVDAFDAIGSGNPIHPHGTAIAGAIVSQARLRGTAPAARILAVRAFAAQRSDSRGTTYNILKGLDWAVARGARIVNMSFTGARDPAVLRELAIARGKGVVLIAAAGNAGPNAKPLFPAADPNVIAVTATDEDDNLFRSANRGPHIAVAAPGVDLLLPAPGGEYQSTSGTSFAAAEVSGAVALMLERNPGLSPDAVRQALVATARDLGPKGADPLFGAGLVDAYAAVLAVAPAMAAPAAVVLPAAAIQ